MDSLLRAERLCAVEDLSTDPGSALTPFAAALAEHVKNIL
jgi:hypothetical protein